MFKNWKTTSTGITLIVGAIVGVYFALQNNQLNEAAITGALTSLLTGIGLLFSKDHDVTGGTVTNEPNDASIVEATAKTDLPK